MTPEDTAIKVQTTHVSSFFPLLSKGFNIPFTGAVSLFDFLQSTLELKRDYIEARLQTVLLDGMAVDDMDQTIIYAGMTLALSAAMPGLVGATFRRAGRYAGFRESVSHKTDVTPHNGESGLITLKLFNFIAGEIGPDLLSKGVFITGRGLSVFIQKQWQNLEKDKCRILINDKRLSKEGLINILMEAKTVFLKVLPDIE